jgi:hypothetical protein
MLTQPQVQRYSNESGLRDIMIAEKEVVLTFLLQLLSERGILNRLIFDLGIFATRPLNQPLILRLVVLMLWQARDSFDPARLMQKFQDGREFDWDDLLQLVRWTVVIDREWITDDCVRGFGFLAELTDKERIVANDRYQREETAAARLREEL